MSRFHCLVLFSLIACLAIADNGFGDTQTSNAFSIEIGLDNGLNSPALKVGDISTTIVFFGSDGVLLSYESAFEPTEYSTISVEPSALSLYAGYFDPRGQFT